MKLIDCKCPNCNANLKADNNQNTWKCEYCGANFVIEEAINNFNTNSNNNIYITNNYYNTQRSNTPTNNANKKSNTMWLWVLGWIFLFPVPLTILIARNKTMKPVIKYSLIATLWIIILLIGAFSDNKETIEESYIVEDAALSQSSDNLSENSIVKNEVRDNDEFLNNYINNIVDNYNSKSEIELVYNEDFIPSDNKNSHYRTEFMLNAFSDANGKSYLLNNNIVDIVAANKAVSGGTMCRVYANGITINDALDLINIISPILDNSLSQKELKQVIDEVTTKKTASGYYYGNLGITLFGNEENGYDLMIKLD